MYRHAKKKFYDDFPKISKDSPKVKPFETFPKMPEEESPRFQGRPEYALIIPSNNFKYYTSSRILYHCLILRRVV